MGFMVKVVDVAYKDGVFKPLEKVDLKEKTKLRIVIKNKENIIESYKGVLGEAKVKELKRFEEEAQIE